MRPTLTLGQAMDAEAMAGLLGRQGLTEESARRKAALLGEVGAALRRRGLADDAGVHMLYVPGRIEVLGKHTDYAGGRSVVTAADRGFCVLAAPRGDARLNFTSAAMDEHVSFEIGPDLTPSQGHWSNYLMTVARRAARNFPPPLVGADVGFASDLPPASGMSSSSAMIVACFMVLDRVNDLSATGPYRSNISDALSLAEYLGTNENGQTFGTLVGDKGVGTFGGSEDHTAILCCRSGSMSQYSYCPVRFERLLPLPQGHTFAVAFCGIHAEKTGGAMELYNRASLLARAAAEAWSAGSGKKVPHLAAALATAGPDEIRQALARATGGQFAPNELVARFDQFYLENEQVIPRAGDALLAGDLRGFGEWVDRSQQASDALLGNQIPQTVDMTAIAREIGAVAASAFGAGFGGSVWAIVPTDRCQDIIQQWRERYQRRHPAAAEKAMFFQAHAGPAAFAL